MSQPPSSFMILSNIHRILILQQRLFIQKIYGMGLENRIFSFSF